MSHFKHYRSVIYFLSILLTACGSGDDGEGTVTNTDDSANNSSANISEPPEATILFPLVKSLTAANTIVVRGTASEPDGDTISAVTVNGVDASSDDGFANWQATVILMPGENTLTVETSDVDGNSDDAAASVEVEYQPAMLTTLTAIDIDNANNRLFAVDILLGLMEIDLDSGGRTMLSSGSLGTVDPIVGSGPEIRDIRSIAFDADNNRALALDNPSSLINTDPERILAIDLNSGDRSILSGDTVGSGVDFREVNGMSLDEGNDRLLVVRDNSEELLAVDLSTGNRSIISDATIGVGPQIRDPDQIDMDANNNKVFITDTMLDALFEVDLVSGDRSIVSDSSTGSGVDFEFPRGLAMDTVNNRVLVIDPDLDSLLSVNPTSGDRSVVSSNTMGSGEEFVEPSEVVLDSANNRAIISDYAIFSVDLADGDRTILSASSIGTGPSRFGWGSTMSPDLDNDRIVVLDAELQEIFSVDLLTGNRTIISNDNTGTGVGFRDPQDMVLDSSNNRALLVDTLIGEFSADSGLYSVDLNSGNRRALSGGADALGEGPELSWPRTLVLDDANSRTYIGTRVRVVDEFGDDEYVETLLAVDLNTGDRTIVSDETTGGADCFSYLTGLALDVSNNRVLAIEGEDSIVAIDLTSGNCSIISDESHGAGTIFNELSYIEIDDENNRLLLADNGQRALMTVDLDSGDRTVLMDASTEGVGIWGAPTSFSLYADSNLALAIDFILRALLLVDLETGQRVIVSK